MSANQKIILMIFIVYLILNAAIGIIFSKRQNKKQHTSSEKKFFIGGRNMNGLLLAMTTMATYTSVSSFISGPGAAGLTYGYAQAWIATVQVPITFLVLGVLGNKLALVSRRTGAVTVVGYLKARYKSDVLVIVTSLLMVIFFMAQMIGQFTGGATLISSITGLDHVVSLLIFGAVVIIYTSFGGFSAVAITDTIQGIIMCVGTFLLLFFVLKAGGGLAGIDAGLAQNLPGVYNDLFSKYSPGTLLSFWILVGFGTLGLPQTAVRSMGFKNTKSLHSAMWIGAVTCSFIIVGMHMAGTWAGALVDTKNLPILASAAIVKDLWRNYVVKDDPVKIKSYNKNVGKMSTLVTFAFGVIVILLTINPPDIIFFLNLFALGGLECSFFWPLVGGLFWKKGTKQAAVFSSIGAAITYVFCYYNVQIAGINAVVWGLLAGGILYFVIGNITCKNGLDEDIIKNCF